jgi:transcriptional regulator with XRE-family HTH domain
MLTMAPITPTRALVRVILDEAHTQRLSIRQLAERSLIPNSTLARKIAGVRPLQYEELVALAGALGTTAGDLASRADALTTDAA